MTELNIVESKELREQVAGRVEVLGKVKELFLLPELEMMTMQQVADYYEVPQRTVGSCYRDNKEEVGLDGAIKYSSGALKKRLIDLQGTVETKYYKEFRLSEDVTLRVPNAGIILFPKRAILRIGMLLRDSEVAKEVRTQLLNTFEHSTDEAKVADINNENEMYGRLGLALGTGDMESAVAAISEIIQFKNRHIEAVETSNKMLAKEILRWDDRKCVNKAIRIIAGKSHTDIALMWKKLYDELRYKHGIGLSQRGFPPYIQHVKEDEWPAVQQSLAAICEDRGLNPAEIFEKSKIGQGV